MDFANTKGDRKSGILLPFLTLFSVANNFTLFKGVREEIVVGKQTKPTSKDSIYCFDIEVTVSVPPFNCVA